MRGRACSDSEQRQCPAAPASFKVVHPAPPYARRSPQERAVAREKKKITYNRCFDLIKLNQFEQKYSNLNFFPAKNKHACATPKCAIKSCAPQLKSPPHCGRHSCATRSPKNCKNGNFLIIYNHRPVALDAGTIVVTCHFLCFPVFFEGKAFFSMCFMTFIKSTWIIALLTMGLLTGCLHCVICAILRDFAGHAEDCSIFVLGCEWNDRRFVFFLV